MLCWECGFNSVPFKPSVSFSSNVVCFKIRNQLLGQIFVICHVLCIADVKPNCQLVILYFMAKLPYNQLVTCQKCHRSACWKGIYRKEGHSENYQTWHLSFLFFLWVLFFLFSSRESWYSHLKIKSLKWIFERSKNQCSGPHP